MIGAELIALRRTQGAQIFSHDADRSSLRGRDSREQAQEGAFAASAGASDEEAFADGNTQICDGEIWFTTFLPRELDIVHGHCDFAGELRGGRLGGNRILRKGHERGLMATGQKGVGQVAGVRAINL